MNTPETPVREFDVIVQEIARSWHPVWFGAEPYLNAMLQMSSIDDTYGLDDGRSIVRYFLANASTWRGEVARRCKAELKALLG